MSVTANGVDLTNLGWNVGDITGRLTGPPRRGKDVDVPGRHGQVRTPHKKFSSGTVILKMWANGADDDGLLVPGATMQETLRSNVDMLVRVLSADNVLIVETRPDASIRQINGQMLDALDLTALAGGSRVEFAASFNVADAFWEDVSAVTALKSGTGVWNVSEFTGATAPMDDMVVRFDGPCTNPRLTSSSGVYLEYSDVLASGKGVGIDCKNWTLTGYGGLTVSYSKITHGGDYRWFTMDPNSVGGVVPRVTASQTAGSTGTFTLTGKRKYLTS